MISSLPVACREDSRLLAVSGSAKKTLELRANPFSLLT